MPVAQRVTTMTLSTDVVFGEHPKGAQRRNELLAGLGTLMAADFNALGIDVSPPASTARAVTSCKEITSASIGLARLLCPRKNQSSCKARATTI